MKQLSINEQEAVRRCEYASKLLTEANIPFEIKKKEIGHINLLYMGKVVMSFWARTGKFVFTKLPRDNFNWKSAQEDRGIKNCIKYYKKEFKKC